MDVVDIIRRRIDTAPPGLYYIPNCDVRLLLLEIDRLRELLVCSAVERRKLETLLAGSSGSGRAFEA